jgi:anti-sigma-K factor RskA
VHVVTAAAAAARDPAELADEYVLGLLDPAEAAEVEALLETEPELRAAVAAARDRFLELDLTALPRREPSDALWRLIEANLGGIGATGTVTPRRRRQPRAGGPRRPTRPAPERRWRAAALVGLAASVLLAVGLGWRVVATPEPQVIAVLLDDAGRPLVLVEDYGDDRARVIPLADLEIPEGRALQLWTLPDPATGPVSLGLLQRASATTLEGPELPAPRPEQLYEITVEPETGSPTGRPTGPIVVKGFAREPR